MGLWASETGAEIGQVESELQAHEADTSNPHAVTAAQAGAIPTTEKGAAGGVATLDGAGKISSSELPPLAHDVGEAATEAAMLALAVTAPAMCVRSDFAPPHVFMLTADPATDIANWSDTGELGAGAANPTATVGPAATNGVANTFMRSDAAPAINLTATFAWTGDHSWTQPISVAGTVSAAAAASRAGPTNTGVLMTSAPNVADVQFFDSAHTANNRTAEWIYFQNKLQARFKNDAGSSAVTPLAFAGGQASGITGIESDSGSGVWTHMVNGQVAMTFGRDEIVMQPNVDNGKIRLYDTSGGSNFTFYGFGVASQTLIYQVTNSSADHVFYATDGSDAQVELFRVKGAGDLVVPVGYVPATDNSMTDKKYVDGRTLTPNAITAIQALTPSSPLADVIAALQAQ